MDNTVYYPDYYLYPPSEFEDLAESEEETEEDKRVQAEEAQWESDTDR